MSPADGVPKLAPGVRLTFDRRRDCWLLQAPERVVLLDEIGAAILQKIDGTTPIAGIIAALARDYEAGEDEIAGDIAELLADLTGRGLLVVN